ncbi:MAG TPA: Hsp70 family protein [Verrucomicrobiae bacterium]|nr:Hsp70 family protein [Verrucomicrobiae bacterium]
MSRRFRFLPLTLRLETLGGVATPLVLRGTPLPTSRSQVFSTTTDNQTAVQFNLLLGESSLCKHNAPVGVFHLRNIPPAPRGSPINVVITIDETCSIKAQAGVESSTLSTEGKFDAPAELSDEFIANSLVIAETIRVSDEESLRLIEATNRANGLIAKAEAKLKKESNGQLSNQVAALGLALEAGHSEKIREHSNLLESILAQVESVDMWKSVFSSLGPRQTVAQTSSSKLQPRPRKIPSKQEIKSSPPLQVLGKIFGGGTFTLDPQLCFILMPFAKKFQPIFDDHVRLTVEKAGLRCERADEIRGVKLITWDIWERVNRARFLIADLTDQNANVFYELGLAHALNKDVILLTQSMEFVPFDLKALRCICYEFRHGEPRSSKGNWAKQFRL